MRTLGMIGGVGPESTIDYYGTIIRLYRERVRDGSYPQFLINSIDMNKGRSLIEANDLPGLVEMLRDEIEKLARGGAEFGLIAANTPHLVFDQLAACSPVPLISIVEATCAVARSGGLNKLALFGTRFTMSGDFYQKVFSRQGIELVSPEAMDQDYIHDNYMNELVHGRFLPETQAGLLAIVDRVREESGVDGVILAGTELPLILRQPEHKGTPLLNTTRIHCQAAVAEMVKGSDDSQSEM